MATGAQTLLSLLGQGGGGADQLALRDLQGRRATELEDQIGANAGFKDPVSAATILRKGLFLKGLERDMNQDPDMGLAAQQRVADIERQNDQALDYFDPQNTRMRDEQFQQKMDLATAPARIQGQFALDAANSKAQAQADALATMLQFGGNRSMSLSGIGSVGAPPRPVRQQQIPAAAMNKYTAAKAAAQKAQGGGLASIKRMLGLGGGENEALAQARRGAYGYVLPGQLLDQIEQASSAFQPGQSADERAELLLQMFPDFSVEDEDQKNRVLQYLLEF